MASIYCCKECGTNLNLRSTNLFPPDFYFEAGNKGTLSFAMIDDTKFNFEKEDKFRPFFETLDYWGIQRNRTKMKCKSCGKLVGYVYDDGPPLTESPGQFHMGPSQAFMAEPLFIRSQQLSYERLLTRPGDALYIHGGLMQVVLSRDW
ncbi:Peptide methionine sulfoxide reductase MrsB [Gossypium australe]|uniref:Peptide methionine sulfoxide reductase MrsB n=1 Tax=Gossypium australe TaxID=47621 RepID=A0A5B6UHJ5_9ROSI|nr:Peptide methionine sulfoxide reductase MrsB [Gossypium australe]